MNFLLYCFPHTQNVLIRCLDHSLSTKTCSHKLLIESTLHISYRYVIIEIGKLLLIFRSCKCIYILVYKIISIYLYACCCLT